MKKICWLMLAGCCLAVPARPEVVEFKNGDQLTGNWVRVEGAKLMFQSEAVGEVSIPVAKVRSFHGAKPAVVLLKNGQAFRGTLSLLDSGQWELREGRGVMRIAPADVVAIYSLEIYQPKGKERPIRPWHDWKGQGNFGYSLVRGDRQAGTLSVGLNATRRQPNLPGLSENLRTNYFLTMLFANTRTNALRISANSFSSGVRQDFLFTPTNFWFLLAQIDHIQTQSLDLRQTYGAGLGRDVIHKSHMGLDFLGGLTFVREDFQTAVRRRNAEGLLGEKLGVDLTERVRLTHQLSFYPNLTDTGSYRFDTTTTLSTRVSSRLSFHTTFTRHFLSRPLPGRMTSESVLTTGLGINF